MARLCRLVASALPFRTKFLYSFSSLGGEALSYSRGVWLVFYYDEELGLNVARQEDNGANPRPDNRSGWLEGEAPRTPVDELIDSQDDANFWDPSTQLRHRKKTSVPPRPDGAPNAYPELIHVEPAA